MKNQVSPQQFYFEGGSAAEPDPVPFPLLELRGITKQFPGVVANDDIFLTLWAGEIQTLLGENGAGKSTLLNILSGMLQPDRGQILIDGQVVALTSPHEALKWGIGTVYQHFTLVPTLSVIENVLLGLKTAFILDLRQVERRLQALLGDFGLAVSPQTEVQHLSLGQQQRVEIIKALFRGSRVLLLDEPTSVLTPAEVADLFEILRRLKARGTAIVFITHKLDEALTLSDRITILRQGQQAGELGPERLAHRDRAVMTEYILKLMFGAAPVLSLLQEKLVRGVHESEHATDTCSTAGAGNENNPHPNPLPLGDGTLDFLPSPPGTTEGRAGGEGYLRSPHVSTSPVACTLHEVAALGDRGVPALRGITFQLQAGEILGIAGVDGNGQKELGEVLAGQRPVSTGQIMLGRVNIANRGTAAARRAGVGYLTDDRLGEAGVPSLSVAENAALKRVNQPPFSRRMVLNRGAMAEHARRLIQQFNIMTPGPWARLGTLSGGNIQKLLLARELAARPKVLVCNKPTQGLDTLTAQFVLATLREGAAQGMAVLLISSELEELLAYSDRIGVMYNGRLLDIVPVAQADEAAIGRLMLGLAP